MVYGTFMNDLKITSRVVTFFIFVYAIQEALTVNKLKVSE